MRAVVFSGTTEGRVYSKQLAALGAEVLVSQATPLCGCDPSVCGGGHPEHPGSL